MTSDYYQWTVSEWEAYFLDQGETPKEARQSARDAYDWHCQDCNAREAYDKGGPNDMDPNCFWIGFSC